MSEQKEEHVHFFEYHHGEWDSGSEVVYYFTCSCGKERTDLCGSGKEWNLLASFNSHIWKIPECPKGFARHHDFHESKGFLICRDCKGMIKIAKDGKWKW